ncbi:TPA: hypothetical protein DEP21_03785 [Patescibacteria group bacterium]|nr:hypothetical protein [Candidatus Gracilibacteria bacterium]
MKAKPAIDSVEHLIKTHKLNKRSQKRKIVMMSPSQEVFCQRVAHDWSTMKHIIFVCARYEGIDSRFEHYMKEKYSKHFIKVSLGQFVTLGGEFPAMVMTESVVRLIPGVIKEEASWKNESYSLEYNMTNIEHPQYTKPEDVYGYKVPEILLSGHHKNIEKWKKENMGKVSL